MKPVSVITIGLIAAFAALPLPLHAQPLIVSDSGDTGWLLAASLFSLAIILPGLALFHGARVNARNALSAMLPLFVTTATVSLLWIAIGYSLVFGVGSLLIGGLGNMFLANLDDLRVDTTIPESAFALFHMVLAVLAPCLVAGAVAERIRFGWIALFGVWWSLIVYVPLARWLWGDGWLAQLGTLDFAGGIVVQTSAGVAALVLARMAGPRAGFGRKPQLPHSPVLALGGAGLIWVGWLALCGGATLMASDDAAIAITNAHLAACAGALIWGISERTRSGKLSSIGFASGAVAGLAAISASASFVGPLGAIVIGAIAGITASTAAPLIRRSFRIDDALGVFAVHGLGGITGSMIFPLFILAPFGPGFEPGVALTTQLAAQAIGTVIAIVWSAAATIGGAFVISYALPMRADEDAETISLDLASHGERAWDIMPVGLPAPQTSAAAAAAPAAADPSIAEGTGEE